MEILADQSASKKGQESEQKEGGREAYLLVHLLQALPNLFIPVLDPGDANGHVGGTLAVDDGQVGDLA